MNEETFEQPVTDANQTDSDEDIYKIDAEAQQLADLKHRADLMGLTYHPSIGIIKLQEKIQTHLDKKEEKVSETPKPNGTVTKLNRNPALALVRCRITCMDPSKKEYTGEIFCVGNSVLGTHKRMIPFEKETHVPRIILNALKEKKYQTFVTERTKNGASVKRGKLVRTFAIEELPPLTPKEIQEIKQRQLMAEGNAA